MLSVMPFQVNSLAVCTYLSFEAPPTPAPLLAIETVASSKLQAAAEAIDAPESRSEDTKPKDTFMVDVCEESERGALE